PFHKCTHGRYNVKRVTIQLPTPRLGGGSATDSTRAIARGEFSASNRALAGAPTRSAYSKPSAKIPSVVTVSPMGAEPLRACASAIVTGIDFAPALVFAAIVPWNEYVPSPGVTSPLVPSSKNACVALPPIALRLAVTVRAVLVGFVPGVVATVNSEAPP